MNHHSNSFCRVCIRRKVQGNTTILPKPYTILMLVILAAVSTNIATITWLEYAMETFSFGKKFNFLRTAYCFM